jgi:hypothetical protein
LRENDKIAVIFARCKEGFYQIPISNRIEAYDLSSITQSRSEFIKNTINRLRDDFELRINEYYSKQNHNNEVIFELEDKNDTIL